MTLPHRKEISLFVNAKSHYENIFQIKFDDSNSNMFQWLFLYICNLSLMNNSEKIKYQRIIESMHEYAMENLKNKKSNKQFFIDIFEHFLKEINTYPHVYTDVYDEVVTKDIFSQQFLELIIDMFKRHSIDFTDDFPNPYVNDTNPIVVINR